MHTPISPVATAALGAGVGTESPTSIEQRHGPLECPPAVMLRVGIVLQNLSAAREVSDAEILQHCQDCIRLMEAAYQRFEEYGIPADRDEAVLWSDRRAAAMRALSPDWRAAREAQVLKAAEDGGCYFIEQADGARQAMGERG